jgi:hypothetical protein
VYGELLGRLGVTVNLPSGVDLDVGNGVVIIPDCEDGDPPIIKFPQDIDIDLDSGGDGNEDDGIGRECLRSEPDRACICL